jgi:hypothetical protein
MLSEPLSKQFVVHSRFGGFDLVGLALFSIHCRGASLSDASAAQIRYTDVVANYFLTRACMQTRHASVPGPLRIFF